MKDGGIVYLPIPDQFYNGIVGSSNWIEMDAYYHVGFIKRSEVNCHPLVRSDTCIRTLIVRYGNNVQQSLVLLSCKAGAFMALTRKARGDGTNDNDE